MTVFHPCSVRNSPPRLELLMSFEEYPSRGIDVITYACMAGLFPIMCVFL